MVLWIFGTVLKGINPVVKLKEYGGLYRLCLLELPDQGRSKQGSQHMFRVGTEKNILKFP